MVFITAICTSVSIEATHRWSMVWGCESLSDQFRNQWCLRVLTVENLWFQSSWWKYSPPQPPWIRLKCNLIHTDPARSYTALLHCVLGCTSSCTQSWYQSVPSTDVSLGCWTIACSPAGRGKCWNQTITIQRQYHGLEQKIPQIHWTYSTTVPILT